jgi:cytochrome oxidase Cu insertion factor (SCO1/SenC/PrrC family)
MTAVVSASRRTQLLPWMLAALAGVLLAAGVSFVPQVVSALHPSSGGPKLHWAFHLGGRTAPDFALHDQFGHRHTLSSFRGKEVVLAFVDSRCTAVCPLTAEILTAARERLSPSEANQIELVAVNANPLATSTRVAYTWSAEHHMLHRWTFLTGPPGRLRNIYAQYRIFDVVTPDGQVQHDAAVILIDPRGREQLYFNTAGTKQPPIVTSEEAAYARGMEQVLHQG